MLTQFPGYAFTMPLYALAHLHCSRTALNDPRSLAKEVRPREIIFLRTLVPSIVLGYLIPTVLMCLPFSWFVHQWIAALWQGFPLWVFTLQYILGFAYRRFGPNFGSVSRGMATTISLEQSSVVHEQPLGGDHTLEMNALNTVYLFSIGVSTFTHLATVSLVLSRILFPKLFSKFALEALSFQQVFLPPASYLSLPMKSMGVAILNFFQYDQYVGAVATVTWAMILWCHSQRSGNRRRGFVKQMGKTLVISILAGPGTAFVALVWDRDLRLIGGRHEYQRKGQ